MVAAKFLRAAPRPETWDARAEALLKSLGGDKAKRRQALKETLDNLNTDSLVRKVPRPGRKTHAENAIAFYRHVLAMNEGELPVPVVVEEPKKEEEEKEEEAKPPAAEKKPPAKPPASEKKRPAKPPASNKPHKMRVRKVDESSKSGDAYSVGSMDSEEFLNQHNDLCEVCNDAGELICCSTCNLVFHLGCIRPPTTRFPPDKWCCAYCVAAGVKGHTKEARTRRRMAAAAREMTAMKNELNPNYNSESAEKKEDLPKKRRGRPPKNPKPTKDEDEKKEPAKLKTGSPPKQVVASEDADEAKDEEPDAKKQTLQLDESKPEDDTEEPADGQPLRRSRERRQPALYNPQSGPAKKWQSDGKLEWKSLGDSTDGDTDGASKNSDDETDDASSKSVVCKFCHDDPAVAVCCFCACRVCFGKHDKSKLLICDNCDDEYHIYCLDPPLKSVPHTKEWFCTTCKNAPKVEAKPPPEPKAETKRKKAGRPPKKAKSAEDTAELPKRRGRPPKKLVEDTTDEETEPVVKKRRGRPPKKLVEDTTDEESEPVVKKRRGRPQKKLVEDTTDEESEPVAKKRRGRPPKKLVEDTTDEESEPVAKKRRGRPPKKKKYSSAAAGKVSSLPDTPVRSNVGKKKRGRPPKNKKSENAIAGTTTIAPLLPQNSEFTTSIPSVKGAPTAAAVTAPPFAVAPNPQVVAPVPAQKSRSGRTVKRNPFHDEIYEGAQLMPSRQSVEPAATGMAPPQARKGYAATQAKQNPSYQAFPPQPRPTPVPPNPTMSQPSKMPTNVVGHMAMPPGMNAPPMRPAAHSHSAYAAPAATMPRTMHTYTPAGMSATQGSLPVPPAVLAYPSSAAMKAPPSASAAGSASKAPRRKPGARECMQMSRRFGVKVIPQEYMETLYDYCSRGKVDHLIRTRERLDDHSRMLEAQLAGLESLAKEKGELAITVPPAQPFDKSPPK